MKYRIVTAYKPFKPEAYVHTAQSAFDWLSAIRMVTATAKWSNHCDVKVLSDWETEIPAETIRFDTLSTRLTLWILEIRLRYLESKKFDRPTVIVDTDELIYGSLAHWFPQGSEALTVLVRTGEKHQGPEAWPLLNGVQWWNPAKKKALVRFYTEALKRASEMSEEKLVWGSETDAVRSLIEPIQYGTVKRFGMAVKMVPYQDVLETFSTHHMAATEANECPWPTKPIVDFRWLRKQWIKPCFEQTWLRQSKECLEAWNEACHPVLS